MARILSIGPDRNVLATRNRELRSMGHDVRGADTRANALALAKYATFEFILLCDRFLPAYAAELADELRILAPDSTILVLAGRASSLTSAEINTLLANHRAGGRAA